MCVKKNILNADNLSVIGDCQVKWNGNELLSATVIAPGDKAAMNKAEEELLKCSLEEEEDTELSPSKKAKYCKQNKKPGKENKKCTPQRKTPLPESHWHIFKMYM